MIRPHEQYEIDDARQRFDVSRVQQWMATTYWWGEGATPQVIARACENSALLVGAYCNGEQVACCRLVSDKTRFAWLADVFVDRAHRNRGLARAMVRFVLDHPDYQTITRFMLATGDAHGVYAELGFAAPVDPQCLMQFRPHDDSAR